MYVYVFFFFQAEDGIRDSSVTGVQTCALPIYLVGEGNFEAQVEQVFGNLKLALEAAGATMADIVKMNIYLVAEVDQAEVPKLRAIRDRYVNVAKPPPSTLVVATPLAPPDCSTHFQATPATP